MSYKDLSDFHIKTKTSNFHFKTKKVKTFCPKNVTLAGLFLFVSLRLFSTTLQIHDTTPGRIHPTFDARLTYEEINFVIFKLRHVSRMRLCEMFCYIDSDRASFFLNTRCL